MLEKRHSKFFTKVCLTGVVIFILLSSLLVNNFALAQTPAPQSTIDPPTTAAIINQTATDEAARAKAEWDAEMRRIDELLEKEKEKKTYSLYAVAWKNAFGVFMTQYTKFLTNKLLTGAPGAQPVFETRPLGQVLTDASQSAVIKGINTLTTQNDWFTFNVCKPSIGLDISMQLGLLSDLLPEYTTYEPDCSWQELKDAMGNFKNDLGQSWDDEFANQNYWLQKVSDSFQPTNNDLGVYFKISSDLTDNKKSGVLLSSLESQVNGGIRNIVSTVSGGILTPSKWVGDIWNKGTDNFSNQMWTFTGQVVADSMNMAISMILSNYINAAFEGLSTLGEDDTGVNYTGLLEFSDIQNVTRRDAVLASIEAYYGVPPVKVVSEYTLLTTMMECPTNISGRSLYSCTMDQGLYQAVQGKLTVAEAIKQKMLNPNKPFGFSGDPRNEKQPTMEEGYAYNSMKKLRLNRIIPLGWEAAAEKIAACDDSVATQPKCRQYTLGEIVAAFDRFESPFYHLVDPNWVLKAPEYLCKNEGYGQIPDQNGTRNDYCADVQSCLKESSDGSGTCEEGSYGYCLKEKSVWRMKGDVCEPVYNSCLTFTNTNTSEQVNYLLDTVNKDGCDASNAGCRWYATTQDAQGNWLSGGSNSRIYFNKQVQEASCDAGNAGCSRVIRSVRGGGTNLITNASFEDFSAATQKTIDSIDDATKKQAEIDKARTAGVFRDWGNSQIGLGVDLSWAGNNGLQLMKNLSLSRKIDTGYAIGDRIFTFSFLSSGCSESTKFNISGGTEKKVNSAAGWQSNSTTVLYPYNNTSREITFTIKLDATTPDTNCVVDGIQLEEGSTMSEFRDYGETASAELYIKKAPDYLGCDGTSNQQSACYSYTTPCTTKDVGCELFTPVDTYLPPVTGQVSSKDYCPAECVGYKTYKQSASNFEDEAFPVYLIASRGTSCDAANVGCDEFTNMDEVARGGEGREYYKQLKQCEKPADNNSAVYYTWEGSDITGYQLKTFTFKKGAPQFAGETGNPPAYATTNAAELASYETLCNKNLYQSGLASPDCRELYDTTGQITYRLISRVMNISDNCHPYRRTDLYTGGTETENALQCTSRYGRVDSTSKACIFDAIPAEGLSCSAQYSGCREYVGNGGNNYQYIRQEDFEKSASSYSSSKDPNGNFNPDYIVDGVIAEEASTTGGHSLEIQYYTDKDTWLAAMELKNSGDETGRVFMVKFWVKINKQGAMISEISLTSREDDGVTGTMTGKDINFVLADEEQGANYTTNWSPYSAGPITLTKNVDDDDVLYLRFVGGKNLGTDEHVYIDNIELVEVVPNEMNYLLKNSWTIPASCDQDPYGNSAPLYNLGCEAYTDRFNNTHNLKSFKNVCSEEVVGCEAVLDTYNSRNYYEEQWLSPENDKNKNDDLTVPHDSFTYLVNNPDFYCDKSKKGCSYLGLPELKITSGGETPESWSDVLLVNDPDNYSKTLCSEAQNGCNEYSTSRGNYYFKDPFNRVCEYDSGDKKWYKKEESNLIVKNTLGRTPCPITEFDYSSGIISTPDGNAGRCIVTETGIVDTSVKSCETNVDCPSLDYCYHGYAGECMTSANLCTLFIDPLDNYAYARLDNNRVDRASCSGTAAQKKGCVLFKKISDKSLTSSADATYQQSEINGDNGATPINCENPSTDPSLCQPNLMSYKPTGLCDNNNATCYTSEDCPTMKQPVQVIVNGVTTTVLKDFKGICEIQNYGYCFDLTGGARTKISKQCYQDGDCLEDGKEMKCLYENDANTIVKVDLDRECSEWLSCASWSVDKTGQKVCSAITRCNSGKDGASTVCGDSVRNTCYVNADCYDKYGSGSYCQSDGTCYVEPLSVAAYQNRDTSWKGEDYTGYSILHQYPVELLKQYPYKHCSNNKLASCNTEKECCTGNNCAGVSCISDVVLSYNPPTSATITVDNTEFKSCRVYPEDSAPFNDYYGLLKKQYNKIDNICTSEIKNNKTIVPQDCDCSYQTLSAGSSAVYGNSYYEPVGICESGSNKGKLCGVLGETEVCGMISNAEDIKYGTCVDITKKETNLGTKGYCLEEDTSINLFDSTYKHPCLTWYPIDNVAGEVEIYNSDLEAGYSAADTSKYYCGVTEAQREGFSEGLVRIVIDETTAPLYFDPDPKRFDGQDAVPGRGNDDNTPPKTPFEEMKYFPTSKDFSFNFCEKGVAVQCKGSSDVSTCEDHGLGFCFTQGQSAPYYCAASKKIVCASDDDCNIDDENYGSCTKNSVSFPEYGPIGCYEVNGDLDQDNNNHLPPAILTYRIKDDVNIVGEMIQNIKITLGDVYPGDDTSEMISECNDFYTTGTFYGISKSTNSEMFPGGTRDFYVQKPSAALSAKCETTWFQKVQMPDSDDYDYPDLEAYDGAPTYFPYTTEQSMGTSFQGGLYQTNDLLSSFSGILLNPSISTMPSTTTFEGFDSALSGNKNTPDEIETIFEGADAAKINNANDYLLGHKYLTTCNYAAVEDNSLFGFQFYFAPSSNGKFHRMTDFRIFAADMQDQGLFSIRKIEINYLPMCTKIYNVQNATAIGPNTYAFTDRVYEASLASTDNIEKTYISSARLTAGQCSKPMYNNGVPYPVTCYTNSDCDCDLLNVKKNANGSCPVTCQFNTSGAINFSTASALYKDTFAQTKDIKSNIDVCSYFGALYGRHRGDFTTGVIAGWVNGGSKGYYTWPQEKNNLLTCRNWGRNVTPAVYRDDDDFETDKYNQYPGNLQRLFASYLVVQDPTVWTDKFTSSSSLKKWHDFITFNNANEKYGVLGYEFWNAADTDTPFPAPVYDPSLPNDSSENRVNNWEVQETYIDPFGKYGKITPAMKEEGRGPLVQSALKNGGVGRFNAVAVNGADTTKSADAKYTFLGEGDGNIDLSFYAYDPTGNQLPLRKVMIDWDESDNYYDLEIHDGSYMNHRPSCTDTNGDPQKTCHDVSDGFTYLNDATSNSLGTLENTRLSYNRILADLVDSLKVEAGETCTVANDCDPYSESKYNSWYNLGVGSSWTAISNSGPECRANFGYTPQACTSTPFTYSHAYSCVVHKTADGKCAVGEDVHGWVQAVDIDGNDANNINVDMDYKVAESGYYQDLQSNKVLSDLSIASLDAINLALGKKIGEEGSLNNECAGICIFKPRVQTLNNWGWCNGMGSDINMGTLDGEYDGQNDVTYKGNWAGTLDYGGFNLLTSQESTAQTGTTKNGSYGCGIGSMFADSLSGSSGIKPNDYFDFSESYYQSWLSWAEYPGWVVVKPRIIVE